MQITEIWTYNGNHMFNHMSLVLSNPVTKSNILLFVKWLITDLFCRSVGLYMPTQAKIFRLHSNQNLFLSFFYHLWLLVTLQMSNYSDSVLCLYQLVDLWNCSLSAALCNNTKSESESQTRKAQLSECLLAVRGAIVSVKALIGTSPVVASPRVLIQCAL